MIDGKSMVRRVYIQALKAKSLRKVIVTTDDDKIFKHVNDFGGDVVMTSLRHESGTARCDEAMRLFGGKYDAVINIPCDAPFIQPAQIDQVAGCLEAGAEIATLIKRIENKKDYESSLTVKAIINKNFEALYFSRSTIPFIRKGISKPLLDEVPFYKMTGEIFGYQSSVLGAIAKLPPTPFEELENIEPLRWLDAGFRIKVRETNFETLWIDSVEDLEKLKEILV